MSKFKIDAMILEPGKTIQQAFADLEAGRCPHCHKKSKQRQVGHCVYGSCGHRLFQGKADSRYLKLSHETGKA